MIRVSHMGLAVRPIPVKVALRFNAQTHRRRPRLQGAMWAVAAERGAPPPVRRSGDRG